MESWAYAIAADGSATRLALAEAQTYRGNAALLWMHIDGNDPECRAWLEKRSGLPAPVIGALRAVETRPRATPLEDGALVNLRGVNMNPDADPEDLVSIRLWAEAKRIISVNYRPLFALGDLCAAVEERRILDPGDFIAVLASVMTMRLDPVIALLGETLDDLEEDFIDDQAGDLRERIGRIRRTAILLRRYISPQREAIIRLVTDRFDWLTEQDRLALREAADHVTRMVEELDATRERAAILADQLSDVRAEAVAQRTLVLSVVSSIFLPLTFFTGLIGMNVRGIPFAEESWAFAAIAALNVSFGLGLVYFFHRRGWF